MINFSTRSQRDIDEHFYSIVTEELERNEIFKPLWTKALANAGSNPLETQSLYIKYRVQKLKDTLSREQESERMNQREEQKNNDKSQRNIKNLKILNNTVNKTISSFKWVITVVIIIALITFFISYLFYGTDSFYQLWMLSGILLMTLAVYLIFLIKKVKEASSFLETKHILDVLFLILIPFSLLGIAIGVFIPIIGIAMFFTFLDLTFRATKFYRAYSYSKRENLL